MKTIKQVWTTGNRERIITTKVGFKITGDIEQYRDLKLETIHYCQTCFKVEGKNKKCKVCREVKKKILAEAL